MRLGFLLLALSMALSTHALGAEPFAKGQKAFNDAKYGDAMKQLLPLAEQGHPLAELYVGIMYEGVDESVPADPVAATKWLVRAAQENSSIAGTVKSFECGDNCYLTVSTKDGDVGGLCVAKECGPWNDAAEIPSSLIGKRVQAKVGIGERYDGGENFIGHWPAFTGVKVIK